MTRSLAIRWPLVALLAAWAGQAWAELPKVRNLRVTFDCEVSGLPEGAKTVDVWIPIPPSNERQTIKLLNKNELTAGRFTTEKTFGNQLYYQQFDATKPAPMKIELVYDVEVHEFTVAAAKQLISTSAQVPTDEFAPYLRETSMIPIKGRITELARKIKMPEGEPLRAGRAIYDHLVDSMVYNYLAPAPARATPSGPATARRATAPIFIPCSSAFAAGAGFRPITCSACRCRRKSPRAMPSIATAGPNSG